MISPADNSPSPLDPGADLPVSANGAHTPSSRPAASGARAALNPRQATIIELFQEQVSRRPDAPVLLSGQRSISYAQLDRRATEIAERLRAAGVSPHSAIGVCLDRSVDLVASLIAILKVGCVYVPLDRQYPVSRLEFMVLDANVRLVITSSDDFPQDVAWKASVLDLRSNDPVSVPPGNVRKTSKPVTAESAAYILYTSGSTGQPKGVAVPHRAIARLVRGVDYIDIRESDVFLQLSPVSFDAATFEIWAPLLNGARLALAPSGVLTLSELSSTIEVMGVTTLWLTSGLFHQVVDEGLDGYRGLKYLLTGGDVVSPQHANKALESLPTTTLINGYGPTENTTFTTCHVMRDASEAGMSSLPIGRPINGTQVYVLDLQGRPVAEGEVGEIHCGGDGLAIGYVNRPELNEERFVEHRLGEGRSPVRLYKTGDLGRWRADGALEFCGRIDQQVKIRGFRVETTEIEAALCQHPAVRQAAVLATATAGRHKQLSAYVAVGDGRVVAAEELQKMLRRELPEHMIPAHFVCLSRLPLDCNGKVNRIELAAIPRAALPSVSRQPEQHGDTVEQRLSGIWQTVLDLPEVAPQDDFFVLGGDSLLAVALLAQVEREFGVALQVVDLVQNPTVAGLATLLRSEDPPPRPLAAVEIQPGAERPTLFFAPCIHGNLMTIRALASRLDPDQPIFALKPLGVDGVERPHATIEEIIDHYIEQVREVQPQGPYLLCGYSLGGIIAHQMAQRFTDEGEQIPLLILIDAPACGRPEVVHRAVEGWKLARRRLQVAAARALRRAAPELPVNAEMIDTHRRAFNAFTAKPYIGPTVLVRAMTPPHPVKRWLDRNPQNWRRRKLVDPSTTVIWTPGNHESIFAKPNVDIMAKQLQRELDRALQAEPRQEMSAAT